MSKVIEEEREKLEAQNAVRAELDRREEARREENRKLAEELSKQPSGYRVIK